MSPPVRSEWAVSGIIGAPFTEGLELAEKKKKRGEDVGGSIEGCWRTSGEKDPPACWEVWGERSKVPGGQESDGVRQTG